MRLILTMCALLITLLPTLVRSQADSECEDAVLCVYNNEFEDSVEVVARNSGTTDITVELDFELHNMQLDDDTMKTFVIGPMETKPLIQAKVTDPYKASQFQYN